MRLVCLNRCLPAPATILHWAAILLLMVLPSRSSRPLPNPIACGALALYEPTLFAMIDAHLGHMGPVTHPAIVNDSICRFLERA